MTLRFLEFDLSEDTDGLRTWDALASPAATHTADLLAETQALLLHLQRHLGPPGPIDDGHLWDLDLQLHDEADRPCALDAAVAPSTRLTLALSLTGSGALAEWLSAAS